MCDQCVGKTIDMRDPIVWWDGAARQIDQISELHAAGNWTELKLMVDTLPANIAGNPLTGRSGCPNVLALIFEMACAALAATPRPAPATLGPAPALDMSNEAIWARQRLAAAAGMNVTKS